MIKENNNKMEKEEVISNIRKKYEELVGKDEEIDY